MPPQVLPLSAEELVEAKAIEQAAQPERPCDGLRALPDYLSEQLAGVRADRDRLAGEVAKWTETSADYFRQLHALRTAAQALVEKLEQQAAHAGAFICDELEVEVVALKALLPKEGE